MDGDYMHQLSIGDRGIKRKHKFVTELKNKRYKGEPKTRNMTRIKRYRSLIGRYNLSRLIDMYLCFH